MHPDYYNKNNVKVPSVTTVLKILNKPSLIEWANMIGRQGKAYGPYLNELAVYGTHNHTAIEELLTGKEPTVIMNDKIEKEVRSSIKTFNVLKNDLKLTNCQVEQSMTSDRFGGTVDLIGDIVDRKKHPVTILADFKTSKKVYNSHFIQLGGYLELIRLTNPELFDKIKLCMIILIKYDNISYTYLSKAVCYANFTPVFLRLLDAYEVYTKMEENWSDLMKSATTKKYI